MMISLLIDPTIEQMIQQVQITFLTALLTSSIVVLTEFRAKPK